MLGEHRGGISDVAGVGALVGEAAHRVLEGELQQWALVEATAAGHRPFGAGDQAEVGEADPPSPEGSDTRRQPLGCLAGGDRARRCADGHGALVAHPVDRRGRPLDLVLVRGREGCRLAREAQLEEIDPMAELDQTLAELGRRARSRLGHELFDRIHEATQRFHVARAITHRSIIEQTFVRATLGCVGPQYTAGVLPIKRPYRRAQPDRLTQTPKGSQSANSAAP